MYGSAKKRRWRGNCWEGRTKRVWRNNFRVTTPLLSLFFHWLTPDLAIERDGANILLQIGVDIKEVPAGIPFSILYAWES
jgi:hypothetical protein